DSVSGGAGPNNIVMGWKSNDEIIFRSRGRDQSNLSGQLFLVNVHGGMPVRVPLPRGGFCSFSPDSKKMAYIRIFDDFRTWKRYRGGMIDNIWIHDFESKKTEKITNS